MLSIVNSAGLFGIDGFIVTVECNAQSKISRFELVDFPILRSRRQRSVYAPPAKTAVTAFLPLILL